MNESICDAFMMYLWRVESQMWSQVDRDVREWAKQGNKGEAMVLKQKITWPDLLREKKDYERDSNETLLIQSTLWAATPTIHWKARLQIDT
jgi:hypothetical protein